MKLRIISGRSGSGKSAFVRAELVSAARAGKNAILIVPDQYTFDAECDLMQAMGGGMLGAQVLGFSRLADRVLAAAGGHTRPFLSADGKRMALRKVIEERRNELTVYKAVSVRSGFAEKFCDLIAHFKYSALAPDALSSAAQSVTDELLRQKLHDIAVLYDGLNAFMEGRYIDDEDRQALLAERISQAEFLKGAEVYIDSLPFFLYKTQTYRIIEQLLLVCARVSVTIRCGEYDDEDAAIFLEEARVGSRLHDIARAHDIAVERIVFGQDRGEKRIASAAVHAVEKYLFTPIVPQEKQSDEGITIVEAANRSIEVEAAVNRINELLRAGARYRDIAVVLGQPDVYAPLLRRAFFAHNLVYFMDEKRPLSSHPIVELILASVYAALRGFRRDEVLRAAKTGYTCLNDAQAENFETYCLRFGISFGVFTLPFEKSSKDCELLAEAEEARTLLIPPMIALAAALKSGKTAKEHAEAVYRYLCELKVREQLLELCESLEAENRFDDAAENSQVWNSVMTLLDQIAVLLDGEMTGARFATVIEEGCAAHEIGVIPATTDQILVGDVERTSNRNVEHLIVLGCNDGAIPRENSDDGIINRVDCARLLEAGCKIDAPDSDLHERQIVYACFSRAKQSLYVSWALSGGDGKALAPSSVADRLKALFPEAMQSAETGGVLGAWCENRAFSRLIRGLRVFADTGEEEQGLQGAYAYFASKEDGKIGFILSRLSFSDLAVDSKRLYGAWTRSSVTRVETFNACPYKHMVRYGLKPAIRREYKEQAADEGNFYHAAFDAFVREIARLSLDWGELTEQRVKELMAPILDELEKTHNDGVLVSGARNMARARRLRRTALRTLFAAVRQIQAGDYRPVFSELEFGFGGDEFAVELPDGEFAALCGKVDRVDRTENAVRIIDYKSGKQGFGYDELSAGLKLQLPIYMLAALKKLKQVARENEGKDTETNLRPTGLFYMQVDDPILDKIELDGEGRSELKRYRLDGVVIGEEGVITSMDAAMERYSDIVRVQRTKDGFKGGVLSGEQMNELLHFAQEKTAQGIAEILSGDARIKPVRVKKWTACERCDYRSVCRFEPNTGQFKAVESLDASRFFEKIKSSSSSENNACSTETEVQP